MRTFIAIDIDEHILNQIRTIQQKLRTEAALPKGTVKWVNPANMHLTLKFLGEVGDNLISDVCRIVSETAANYPAFDIEVNGLGSFGSSARVIWVGTRKNEQLSSLQKELNSRLSEAGWESDRKGFVGHLTLCRVKNPKSGKRLRELINNYADHNFGLSGVDSIRVYKSELTNTGPIYTLISEHRLE